MMKKNGFIYLVDSDPSALRGLTRLFIAGGYEVYAYTTFDELLHSPIAEKNACLIIDAQSMSLSGIDLRTELSKRVVQLPIIFISTENDKIIRQKAREYSPVGFFRKPIDGPALLDVVAWALESAGQSTEHNT